MATRIKTAAKNIYEDDFCVWAQNQAELLCERIFDELDLTNLTEGEVEDVDGLPLHPDQITSDWLP